MRGGYSRRRAVSGQPAAAKGDPRTAWQLRRKSHRPWPWQTPVAQRLIVKVVLPTQGHPRRGTVLHRFDPIDAIGGTALPAATIPHKARFCSDSANPKSASQHSFVE